MKPRLVLHLGLWKTGTKTIQSFLRKNPDVLAELGVYYPRVGPDNPTHRYFLRRPDARFVAQEINHQFLGQELAGKKRSPAANLPLWSTAFRLMESSGAHTSIISNESFSARVDVYNFEAIAERLKAFDVVGIIYLRPQEAWTISLYSHEVRRAATALPFAAFVDSIRPRLSYSSLLDQIRDEIPLDSLIVRDFDAASKNDLVEDFFSALDLPLRLSATEISYDVKNVSLPNWAVLFMLKCVQASLPDEQISDIRKALTWIAGNRPPALRPDLDLASPAERADLRAIMGADADRLAEKYGLVFAETEPAPAAAYRPFDEEDFNAIKEAIAPRLAKRTRAAVDGL